MDPLHLAGELSELPERLRDAMVNVSIAQETKDATDAAMKRLRLELLAQISDEIGENGKPRFSNAEKREAELLNRLDVNADAVRLEEKLLGVTRAVARARIELEYQEARLKSYIAIARILGGGRE